MDGKAEVMAKDDEGQTALHRACAAASIPCTALLLSLGAHVDAVDDFGMTPLACVFAERVRSLVLSSRHRPPTISMIPWSPFSHVTPYHNRCGSVLPGSAGCKALTIFFFFHCCLPFGDLTRLPSLFFAPSRVQEASDAQTGQLVHLLVEMGASINRADADGNTPLHHASATIR